MGLTNLYRANVQYVHMFDGKFAVTCDKDCPGAKPRTNKLGNQVYELFYDTLSGAINNIILRDTDYGKEWQISIADGNTTFRLGIPLRSRHANGVLFRLGNIDFDLPVELHSGKFVDQKTGNEIGFTTVYQGGEKIPLCWTKDKPGDLPPLEFVKTKLEEKWDDTKRLEFLIDYVEKTIQPKLQTISDPSNATDAEPETPEGTGDLPF